MSEDAQYLSRLMTTIRRIIRAEFENYTYMGIYEYNIQRVDGMLVDADPTDTTLGLPSIAKIKLKSSILGETVEPTTGKLILVAFVNGSQKRPVVISCDGNNRSVDIDADQSCSLGSSSPVVTIAGGGQPAARMGDTILAAGIFAGTVTSGSSKASIGG